MTKKQRTFRTGGPISDMDYHVIGSIYDAEYQKILERLPKLTTPPDPSTRQPPSTKPQPRKPLTAKELHHIEELVALGMHISEARFVIAIERGDSIGDVVSTPEELDNALGKSRRRRCS